MKNVGNKLNDNKKGFTIIEVVLVLAIAGLIFLIVFLAVPALQRNRRDTQRRSDLGRFVAQLESYASNHNGVYPSNTSEMTTYKSTYMDNFNDPSSGTSYAVTVGGSAPTGVGTIHYNTGSTCNGDTVTGGGDTRDVAASMKLENGRYCQDNK